jgi:hypothetical protein
MPRLGVGVGVTIQLSPEMVEQVRQQKRPPQNPLFGNAALVPLSSNTRKDNLDDDDADEDDAVPSSDIQIQKPASDVEEDSVCQDPLFDEENHSPTDWDELMALPPAGVVHEQASDDEDDDDQEYDNSSDSDDLSMSPPPTLPVLIIDLQALCGVAPTTLEEHEELNDQVKTALTQDDERHFDARSKELLDNNMAIQGDTATSMAVQDLRWSILPYPEYLIATNDEVVITAREWKRLLQPHEVPVVAQIVTHLLVCSQSLLWKMDMRKELLALVKAELAHKNNATVERELRIWKTTQRKTQLQHLYQVRETFENRLEVARQGWHQLQHILEAKVASELRRMRERGQAAGLEALDFTSTEFAFPKEVVHGNHSMSNRDEENEDYYVCQQTEESGEESDCEEEDYEETKDDFTADPSTNSDVLPSIALQTRAKARRQATIKRRRRKLQQQEEMAKRALQEELINQAMQEEDRVRDMCTTQDYRMAQAVVRSLEVRLQQVDELLETLQEEEWADEEEGIQFETSDDSSPTTDQLSLLDQILAMILGTLPIPQGQRQDDHFRFIKGEHTSIVNQWKAAFGRLPPTPTASEPKMNDDFADEVATLSLDAAFHSMEATEETKVDASTLRSKLGIADNNDEWDDGEDWDIALPPSSAPATESDNKTPSTLKSKPGLRPGGKVQMQ